MNYHQYFEGLATSYTEIGNADTRHAFAQGDDLDLTINKELDFLQFCMITILHESSVRDANADNPIEIQPVSIAIIKQCPPKAVEEIRATVEAAKIHCYRLIGKMRYDRSKYVLHHFDRAQVTGIYVNHYMFADLHGFEIQFEVGRSIAAETHYDESFFV